MRGRSILAGVTGLVLFATAASAQVKEEFEVATVKAHDPKVRRIRIETTGGPGTSDPGRITYRDRTLKELLLTAYDLKPYQLSAPAWLFDSQAARFVIQGAIRLDATKEQVNRMLQNLLADRFKITLHRETKNVPFYELTAIKKGPNLREPLAISPEPAPGPMYKSDKDGFVRVPAGASGFLDIGGVGRHRIIGGNQTISELAVTLSGYSNRPLMDKTGLSGRYDYNLEFAADVGPANQPSESTDPAPDLAGALRDQLGLKMEPKTGPIEMLVIDHIEKTPIEN